MWSWGEPELEMDESLVDESKHPPPERGDHNIDGTGIKFVIAWNDSRAASVGDINEGRDGDELAGGDSWACGDGRTGGLFRAGAAEARGVTERDLEGASTVNSRTRRRIRHTHTREARVVGKPTGSRRGHNGDGTRPRDSRRPLWLRNERRYLGAGG